MNKEWQRKWNTSESKLHSIKPRIEEWEPSHDSYSQYEVKLSRLRIGHSELTHGHLMTRGAQQQSCSNMECRNQALTIKHCLEECPKWRECRVRHNICGNIRETLGRDCNVGNLMSFLKDIGLYEDI